MDQLTIGTFARPRRGVGQLPGERNPSSQSNDVLDLLGADCATVGAMPAARQLERAAEQLADVEPDARRKLLGTNAAELYRMSLPA